MSNNQYDLVPYTSLPFDVTRPEYMAAIATLFAVPCPDFKRARVLELGCASGGNIIPLAYSYPDTKIVGVDLSANQIQEGQQHIRELGLTNIELVEMSIEDLMPDFGEFDFIIAHGLHSWVSPVLQHRIMEICSANLSKNGIAYVSFNTLPGWNLVKSIRDLMVFHTEKYADPQEKVGHAKGVLQFMAAGYGEDNSPHAQALKAEMEMLADKRDDYILHDHLESNNNPVYFHDFMSSAKQVGLQYLADVDLSTMSLDKLPEHIRSQLQQLDDLVDIEQYVDFFLNRRFRRTLLRKNNVSIDRNITIEDLKKLYFSCAAEALTDITPENLTDGIPFELKVGGLTFTASHDITKTICVALIERGSKPCGYQELCELVAARLSDKSAEDIDYYLGGSPLLFELIVSQLITINLHEGGYTLEVSKRPVVSKLARYIAQSNGIVTNLRHQRVQLNDVDLKVLARLDGTRTIEELANEIFESGEVQINPELGLDVPEDKQRADLASYCRQCTANFALLGLLEA